ncbi:MAG: hypothetical protein JXB34_04850 [Bacteroidales bacterium]|nr:hypothetical protein [Bacteroidales bacterium]
MMSFWFIILLCGYTGLVFPQYTNCVSKSPDTLSAGSVLFEFNPRTEKFQDLLEFSGSYYPELIGVKIEVRRKKITTMMAARPRRDFLFCSKDKRTYVLLITEKFSMNADSIYNQLGPCAIIGVLGHELSHIADYSTKTNAELLFFGIKYVINRREIEKQTDLAAIEHGFGPGLVEFTRFIHHSPLVDKKYRNKKSKYYLSAVDLESSLTDL